MKPGIIEVSAQQSLRIFGLWDQPRTLCTWADIKALGLSWRELRTDLGLLAEELHRLQPDKKEWISRGRLTLHDLPDMTCFPINPFEDLGADLGEVWSMRWSLAELAGMAVTYEQMRASGITTQIMQWFDWPLSAWVELGFSAEHVDGEEMAAIFGLPAHELRRILRDERGAATS